MNRREFLVTALTSSAWPFISRAEEAKSPVQEISSLSELADRARKDNQRIRLRPGVYPLRDWLSDSEIAERRKQGIWNLLEFSGSGNEFFFEGARLELDTGIRRKLNPPIHTDEILVSGEGNALHGLTIIHTGDDVSQGGAALGITGRNSRVSDLEIHVRGSAPYGYGDLFGKGGYKKSGVHITGSGSHFQNCRLRMESFGHGFYIQEDANDITMENCEVSGVMKSTDEILAETSGFAFDRKFESIGLTRAGTNRIQPGYMKALAEDGFRTYGTHRNLRFINCRAKNMRGGFELRGGTGVRLENCSAFGCERAFWLGNEAQATECEGDTLYGPLLIVEGTSVQADVLRKPGISAMNVHATAWIEGAGHHLTLRAEPEPEGGRLPPVVLGASAPMMGEGSFPVLQRRAEKCEIVTSPTLPIALSRAAKDNVLRVLS